MDEPRAWRWLAALALAAAAAAGGRAACARRAATKTETEMETKMRETKAGTKAGTKAEPTSQQLDAVHVEFVAANFVVRLADWLQGTNMYTLYDSYGVDVATLFLTGFLTSAVAGTFVGSYVDTRGRKRGMLVYCALEVIIQVIEHVPRMEVLLMGRILGGISTALLFSSFESWIVTEHKRRRLPSQALERMFAWNSVLNGVAAVSAGVIARAAHSVAGEVGPFQLALVLSAMVGVVIAMRWPENFGARAQDAAPWRTSFGAAVWTLGLVQACFEGAMYTFVVMWVPSFLHLAAIAGANRPPTELLFSSLMVAISLGGLVFDAARSWSSPVALGASLLVAASASLYTAAEVLSMANANAGAIQGTVHADILLAAFCIFELCCGAFEPWASTLRARTIAPGAMGSAVATMRVPLNVLVWAGVHLSSVYPLWTVFRLLAGLLGLCSLSLVASQRIRACALV